MSSFCFNGVVKSVLYASIWTIRRNLYSKNDLKFRFFFGFWPKDISTFWQAFLGRADKPAFYVATKLSWGEVFEKKIPWPFLDIEQNFSVCKNCIPRVPRKILLNIQIWKKCVFFVIISIFWAFLSSFCQKTSGKIVKTEFRMSSGKLWGNLEIYVFFEKIVGDLIVFRNEKKFQPSVELFPAELWKLLSTGP